jgi:hypothetical protein
MPGRDGGPPTRQVQLLRSIPSDRLEVVCDQEVTEPPARRVDMLERRGSRPVLQIPPEVQKRVTAKARARIEDGALTYRRVEALATWAGVPAVASEA